MSHPTPITTPILDRLCVAGINFHKADTSVRSMFAITKDAFAPISEAAKQLHIRSVFVLSTCNRTEIYGFAEHVMVLVDLLIQHTKGTTEEFLEYAYLKSGDLALQHLFDVACGLDSQILGDYEILGQLKQSVETSARAGTIGPIMNRTVNFALQASKKIKSSTALSTGTVSVSYAAIELLKQLPGADQSRILVIGAGKFGGNVCRNLKQYLPRASITVVNRTDDHAKLLASTTDITFHEFSQLQLAIDKSDIIIVCTNSATPTVLAEHFTSTHNKLILDLSVPMNVDVSVRVIPYVTVIDVDQISSSILDKTIAKRKAEVPKAREIMQYYKNEFCTWLHEYRYSLHLKSWKDKLLELSEWQPQYCELAKEASGSQDAKVQKAMNRLAVNLRSNQEKGCQFINAINHYLEMP